MPVSGTINAKFNGATNNVEIADSHLSLPHSRVDLSGTLGKQLDVQFKSTDLNDFLPVLQATSKTPVNSLPLELQKNGTISFNGTVTGSLTAPQLKGKLQASNITVQGRTFDQIAANLTAGPNGATLQNGVITKGPTTIQLSANIGLKNWKLENTQALSIATTIRNGQMADLLGSPASRICRLLEPSMRTFTSVVPSPTRLEPSMRRSPMELPTINRSSVLRLTSHWPIRKSSSLQPTFSLPPDACS